MKGRSLLFSLLALPACEARVSEQDDPTVPDGGDPSKFDQSCEAYFEAYYACYTEEAGPAGSTGGASPVEDYAAEYCARLRAEAEQAGADCLGAFEEVFACIGSLDCAALEESAEDVDSFGGVPAVCHDVYIDAVERCPEALSACSSFSLEGFGSTGGCSAGASACIDGHTYDVDCGEGEPSSCECKVDDAVVKTVELPATLQCHSEDWFDAAREACEFPVRPF